MRSGLAGMNRDIVEHTGGHLRVLGPPASGKTTLLVDRFRHLEAAGVHTAVIAYTRDHRDRLTGDLLPPDSARFGRVPIYTYHTLAGEILGGESAGASRVIGEMEESILLRRVLRRTKDRISSDYRRTLDSTAFQRTVLSVLHVLFQNGVDDDRCDALIRSTGSMRLRDLFVIYFEFRQFLRSYGFVTYYDEAWRAAELAAQRPGVGPFAGAGVLLIDDFQDVDPGQYALIRAVAPPHGNVRVEVFGDPTGARFGDRGTTDQFLTDVFPRDYRPKDVRLPLWRKNERSLGSVVGALLDKTVGGPEADLYAGESPLVPDEIDVSLTITKDEVAEASFVATRVAELVAGGDYRPDEIAVTVRDKHLYETVLVRAFRDRGLVLETGRRRQPAFAYLVTSLLRYIDAPANEAARNAVTHSPHFAALRGVFESVTGRETGGDETEAIEEIRAEIQRSTVRNNDALDLQPFLATWIRPLLAATGSGETPFELLDFLGRLSDEWQVYADIVDGTKGRRTVSEFLSISRAVAGNVRGEPAAGRVGLYSCREMSSKRFGAVFVAGCSELLFPALPSREQYVPYETLQELLRGAIDDWPVELHAARPNDSFLRDEYALMLTALTRADRALYVSAPEHHRGTSCPAPARILEALPGDRVVSGIDRSPSPFVLFASAIARSGPRPGTAGHRSSDLWNRPAPQPRPVRRRTGRRLSPSSLQAYSICQRKFFYNRVLRVEEDKAAAMAFGTLFHDLMKSLAKDHRTHGALRRVIESDRLATFIDDAIGASDQFAEAGEVVRDAARYHLREMAMRIVQLDAARTDDYEIQHVEETVEFDRGDWKFVGRADRIDGGSGRAPVVIDYKTGGGVNKKGETVRKKTLPGFGNPEERLWQIPLYCRGARPKVGSDPKLFCYYVIQPGGDAYVAGLRIGEEDDATETVFDESQHKNFSYLTPGELTACLDEAVTVAEEIAAQRTEYTRTSERDRCSRCYFQRVCGRTA